MKSIGFNRDRKVPVRSKMCILSITFTKQNIYKVIGRFVKEGTQNSRDFR